MQKQVMGTLRDSFRASFSVGEGQSFSTPLNILVSDWRRQGGKETASEDEEEEVQGTSHTYC